MKAIKYVGMAAMALAMTACSSEENGLDTTNERVAVEFTGNVGVVQTRAVDQAWSANDKIGIFMKTTGEALNTANISEGASNIAYQFASGSAFSPVSTTIYYPMDGSQVDFIAYYPYSDSKVSIDASGASYGINVADQSNQEAIDFMYSNNVTGKSKTDKQAALSFNHQLCKVVLTVQPGDGVDESELTGLTVKVNEQNTIATFDLSNGTMGITSIPATLSLYKQANAYVYEAILLPNTALSRIFEFDLNNNHDAPFTWNMNKALTGGSKYTYTVKLNRTGVEVSGNIQPWNPENGGEVDAN